MDLAKPGEIKHHCDPNGLATFLEYLLDYGSPETVAVGTKCIEENMARLPEQAAARARKMLDRVASGERDVFC